MQVVAQFLMAFGIICGIAAWFLFQKSLSRFMQHLQTDHKQVWEHLGSPEINSPPHTAITNLRLRQYILRKEYMGSADLFVQNMGNLLRQRLLFSFFCLACLLAGIILFLILSAKI